MPRVYFAMAADGVFFPIVARVSERTRAPVVAILLQAVLGIGVALSGTYEQILGYVVSSDFVFFGLSAASLFVLRRRGIGGSEVRFRVPGHPFTTAAFVLVAALVVLSTARAYPLSSLKGLGLVLAGLPLYALLRKRPLDPRASLSVD
jgi:APA family basic amino acid/polyamine antiporter